MLDNRDLANQFMKTSSAQQTIVIIIGVALFWLCVPAFIINQTAGSSVLMLATSVFCFGLVYDIKLILDQQVPFEIAFLSARA